MGDRGDGQRVLLQRPEVLEGRLREIPAEPGVYLFRDREGRVLYIGKSKRLRSRVRSYFRPFFREDGQSPARHLHTPRLELMVRQVVDLEFIVTDTESEALMLEANLIKRHQPHFNVLLKDDKKYPYLCITWSEDYPRLFITRKRRLGEPRDRYYGPYTDAHGLRSTLQLVKRLFPLRQRPRPLFKDRPCLNYDLGRCPGVCQGLIAPDAYRQTVQKVAMVFQGRTGELVEQLTAQMEAAAADLEFERAAVLRDQLRGLDQLGRDHKVALPDDRVSRDAIALATDGVVACIQLFQIRAGRLVGRLGYTAQVPEGHGTPAESADGPDAVQDLALDPALGGQLLQRVLENHYGQVEPVEIPAEVTVQYALPEGEFLAAWLAARRGRRVEITVPQRQTKADLIALVERNAHYELARTRRSSDRDGQALQDLATVLDLPTLPHWIECYDISHIQGSDAVASRVVFVEGQPAKQHYRRYKIRSAEVRPGHSDDFASMAEVIRRRFRDGRPRSAPNAALAVLGDGAGRDRADDWPDLVVVDGGKGQLSAAVAVLRDLDLLDELRIIGLAKRQEEIFLPGQSESLPTDPDQPGVQLLRRLRDEAHRFAVSFHRQQRRDRMTQSRLSDIPGLGHHRQKQLLAHFRSIDYIREATPAQLAEVPGIGPAIAQQIHGYFHPQNAPEPDGPSAP
ncbi:MAG: excinuclease ABC subunit UvrC [Cyanobacteria bacterium]|nr:excinuclease ABC subunit UvrC [Cyanobacteriota bacterium]